MHKRDKREMRISRFAMRATFHYIKDMLQHSEESLVAPDTKKIRIRSLKKLYCGRIKYQVMSLAKWQKETEEAATDAGLNNN